MDLEDEDDGDGDIDGDEDDDDDDDNDDDDDDDDDDKEDGIYRHHYGRGRHHHGRGHHHRRRGICVMVRFTFYFPAARPAQSNWALHDNHVIPWHETSPKEI